LSFPIVSASFAGSGFLFFTPGTSPPGRGIALYRPVRASKLSPITEPSEAVIVPAFVKYGLASDPVPEPPPSKFTSPIGIPFSNAIRTSPPAGRSSKDCLSVAIFISRSGSSFGIRAITPSNPAFVRTLVNEYRGFSSSVLSNFTGSAESTFVCGPPHSPSSSNVYSLPNWMPGWFFAKEGISFCIAASSSGVSNWYCVLYFSSSRNSTESSTVEYF